MVVGACYGRADMGGSDSELSSPRRERGGSRRRGTGNKKTGDQRKKAAREAAGEVVEPLFAEGAAAQAHRR